MYKQYSVLKTPGTVLILFFLFFVSGFTALLYQVVWLRMLGLFLGSDVRSITIVVTSHLLGLGLGSLLGGLAIASVGEVLCKLTASVILELRSLQFSVVFYSMICCSVS